VKNNLAVIGGLFSLQSMHTRDPETLAILRESRDRVRSIALVHEMLYSTHIFSKIALNEYAVALAHQLLQVYSPNAGSVTIDSQLETVEVDISQAVPCGLVLNEMVTNALKHGFRDGRAGRIALCISEEPSRNIVMAVRDDGVGLPAEFDLSAPTTFGLRLMKMLARQLDGTLEMSRATPGTEVRLTFPRPK
jgi:two-component sensor histidine kinase